MEGSVLFYYRNCYVAVVKLTFAVRLGSCVLFFMCKHFKSQQHIIYILFIAASIFNFQSMAKITRLSTLFCGKWSLSNNMLVNHVHFELLLIRIQPLHSFTLLTTDLCF